MLLHMFDLSLQTHMSSQHLCVGLDMSEAHTLEEYDSSMYEIRTAKLELTEGMKSSGSLWELGVSGKCGGQ